MTDTTQPAAPASNPSPAPNPLTAAIAVLTKPAAFYSSIKGMTGLGPALVFVVITGVLSGVLRAIHFFVFGAAMGAAAGAPAAGLLGGTVGAIVMVFLIPIAFVIFAFIGGAIVHVIAMIAGGKGTFEKSVHIACYSSAIAPLSALAAFIPVLGRILGLALAVYALYVIATGILALHPEAKKQTTYVVTGVLGLIVVGCAGIGMLMGAGARMAGSELQAKYGKGSAFEQQMKKMSEDMKKAAEEAQKKQDQQQDTNK